MNAAGLAMIGLAIVLFIIDAFAPTHGVLTAGGIVAFFLGSLMLFDKAGPYYRLSLAVIVPATLVDGGVLCVHRRRGFARAVPAGEDGRRRS